MRSVRTGLVLFVLYSVLPVSDASSLPLITDPYLRIAWEDVTPGEVSAPVRSVWYFERGRSESDRRWGLALVTEDRHMRIHDSRGETVRTVRTGLRAAVDLRQERSGTVLLAERNGTIRRVSPETGSVVPVARVSFEPRRLWLDRDGNIYVVGQEREIAHISPAGTILWQRELPARISTITERPDALYVAIGDGRIFRFDRTGTGQVVYRGDRPFRDLTGGEMGRFFTLVGIDLESRVSAIRIEGESGRRIWSVERPAGERLLGVDARGKVWVIGDTGELGLIDPGGTYARVARVPGGIASAAVLDRARSVVHLVDEELRLLTVTGEGHVESARQLEGSPLSLTMIHETGEVVIRYDDWGMVVLAQEGAPGTRRLTDQRDSSLGSSALGAFTETVLDGTSRPERLRLAEMLAERRESADLYGHVVTYRTAATRLLDEIYRRADAGDRAGINNFPDVRSRAVELLRYSLDTGSREALAIAVERDPDASVAADALRALADLGVDDYGALSRARARFRRANQQDRTVLAAGMIELLRAVLGEGGHHWGFERSLLRSVASDLAASDIPTVQRTQAMEAVRGLE